MFKKRNAGKQSRAKHQAPNFKLISIAKATVLIRYARASEIEISDLDFI
jgi:hypothetical protein